MRQPELDPLLEEVLDGSLAPYVDLLPPPILEGIRGMMRRELGTHPCFRALLEVVRAARLRRQRS